jgi:DNA-binding MarR family transcriptional regulator
MSRTAHSGPEDCNCLAVRRAARHIARFYDLFLAPIGLRTTQFSILARPSRLGPLTINDLAAAMVMDRTTRGRNIRPLQRDGLIAVAPRCRDRRSKELRLAEAGAARFRDGIGGWVEAQRRFEAVFGAERTAEMRALLRAVAATDLFGTEAQAWPKPRRRSARPCPDDSCVYYIHG